MHYSAIDFTIRRAIGKTRKPRPRDRNHNEWVTDRYFIIAHREWFYWRVDRLARNVWSCGLSYHGIAHTHAFFFSIKQACIYRNIFIINAVAPYFAASATVVA